MRNASPEDINRSSLGRMAGGIALLWLASYAVGIPFKYGLAGALLAISAVLFAEWDQGSRARRSRRTGASSSSAGDGPDSIPKFGTTGGIDAKTGAPPGSIHETSIGDISSGAKQNFPQDPISQGIGGTGAGHASHGAASFGGTYSVYRYVLRMIRTGRTACLSVQPEACNTSTCTLQKASCCSRSRGTLALQTSE